MWDGTVGETEGINFDLEELYGFRGGSGYYTNRFQLDYRTSLGNGDVIYYDDLAWYTDCSLDYNTALEIEDFSDDSATVGYWSNNPENWATVGVNDDGKLAVKATETVAWGSRATAVLQNMGVWGKNAVALAYDVDVSEITHELTMYTRFYQTKSDGTESYAPWGNDIYLYGKDGTLKTVTVGTTSDNYAAGVGLPLGFNGTVIIPVESSLTKYVVFSEVL